MYKKIFGSINIYTYISNMFMLRLAAEMKDLLRVVKSVCTRGPQNVIKFQKLYAVTCCSFH